MSEAKYRVNLDTGVGLERTGTFVNDGAIINYLADAMFRGWYDREEKTFYPVHRIDSLELLQ